VRAARAEASVRAIREFARDVREGLGAERKWLPSKYLYDALGSALFEAITELPEYGLTRAEERIFHGHAGRIVRRLPRGIDVAELGAGSGRKTSVLLDAILDRQPAVSYSAVDLSTAAQTRCAQVVGSRPGVEFRPIETTYLEGLARVERRPGAPLLLLFLGSSIGNLGAPEQIAFLTDVRARLREGDALLLGADLVKPVEQLLAAYNDPLGVTAAFDLNVLARINRDLDGDFDLGAFRHEARWSACAKRIEMHLRSRRSQVATVHAAGCRVVLRRGETIWTESSHKFALEDLDALASAAGFASAGVWVDESWPFADALWVARGR
jgi:L-histidine Nalpha-methyltransferase